MFFDIRRSQGAVDIAGGNQAWDFYPYAKARADKQTDGQISGSARIFYAISMIGK